MVFGVLQLDKRVPLGLADVSPDLKSVVLYVNASLLHNLLSYLVGSYIILGEAVKANSVG